MIIRQVLSVPTDESLNQLTASIINQKEIKIKVLYKTYSTNKILISLSNVLKSRCENGNEFEMDLGVNQFKQITIYDKFMKLFLDDTLLKPDQEIYLDKDEFIDFANLVFKYDLVLPIKGYIIENLINYYSLLSISKLETLTNKFQILELKEFIDIIKARFTSLVIKTIDFNSNDNSKKLTNLKLNEQVFRNFFRNTYINCVLQKKKYPNVVSIIGSNRYKEYVIAKSNKMFNDLQYIFEIKNSGFINIDKFIAEKNNIDLINKRKSLKGYKINNGKLNYIIL